MKEHPASVEGLDLILNQRMKKVLERSDHKVDQGHDHVQVVQDHGHDQQLQDRDLDPVHGQDQSLSRVHGQDPLLELRHLQEDLVQDQKLLEVLAHDLHRRSHVQIQDLGLALLPQGDPVLVLLPLLGTNHQILQGDLHLVLAGQGRALQHNKYSKKRFE